MRLDALPASALGREQRAQRLRLTQRCWRRPAKPCGFTASGLWLTLRKDCGGRTASPAEMWPHAQPVPYLPSQPDRFCTADGGREWAAEITRAELTAALAAHGLAAPGWQNLTVARRGESGRAVTLRLDGNEISAEEFRLAVGESLGWNRIPSTWFEVSRQGDRFAFHGRGWGHGVGLCQKGAAAMAAQGRSAAQILQQYFPGAEAGDEATGQSWNERCGQTGLFSNRSMRATPHTCPI